MTTGNRRLVITLIANSLSLYTMMHIINYVCSHINTHTRTNTHMRMHTYIHTRAYTHINVYQQHNMDIYVKNANYKYTKFYVLRSYIHT